MNPITLGAEKLEDGHGRKGSRSMREEGGCWRGRGSEGNVGLERHVCSCRVRPETKKRSCGGTMDQSAQSTEIYVTDQFDLRQKEVAGG